MTAQLRFPHVPVVLLLAGGLAALMAAPASAQIDRCTSEWTEPVVCRVDLGVTLPGERRARRLDGDTLRLATRSGVALEAVPVDQYGRRFPEDRFRYQLDLERGCADLIETQEADDGTLRITSGSDTGSCDLLFWLPNNLNLDRRLRVEVARAERTGYSREESEVLARWLYRGILGREGEAEGVAAAALRIQRGEIDDQVRSMLRSPEFQRERRSLSPGQLLESIYRGLLGRAPDTAGVRSHLDDIQRGRTEEVILRILRSDEIERRLDEVRD